MKPNLKLHSFLLCSTLLATANSTLATQFTWDGGGADGNWNTVANWVGDTFTEAGGDEFTYLKFAGTTNLITNNNRLGGSQGLNVGHVDFLAGAGAFTLNPQDTTNIRYKLDMLGTDGSGNTSDWAQINNFSTNAQTINLGLIARPDFSQGIEFNTDSGNIIMNGVITQNGGSNPNAKLLKTGNQTLTLSGANSYTGGTNISAGTVVISNATALGSGAVSVTGNSRINAAALTYANNISIDASRVLTLGTTGANNSTSTFSGAITGDGSITLGLGVSQGTIVNLSSTNNTFTGDIIMPTASGRNDFIDFASIGDGGSIIFGRASWLANARYTGAANIEWDTRTISLATTIGIASGLDGGGNPSHMFANNGAGTVTINTDMGVTSTATSTIFFLGGTNTGNNTFAGAIADPTGANTLGIGKSGTGTWILSNNTNSYEGNVLLFDGTLSVGDIDVAANAQSLGKGSIIAFGYRTANTGTLEYTGAADAVTDKQIEVGRLANANNNNFRGGAVILNNGAGTLSFSNTTFNSIAGVPGGSIADRTLTLGGSNTGANTIEGTIQDNLAGAAQVTLAKTGNGTWVLGGTNTYTGGTSVTGGTLTFLNTNAKSGTGTHAFGAGTTLGLGVFGASAFTSTDVTNAFAGNMSGNLSGITVTTTTNVGIDTSNGDFVFANSIAGSPTRGLTKFGNNTLTLEGTNTYTGNTAVRAGTLIVNGSISTSVLTTVQNGATLGGSGTVGALTIDAGGTFAPGNSPGITLVNGNYIQNGTLEIEIDGLTPGTQHDQVQVTGTVTLNGLLDLTFSTFTPADGDLIIILLNDGGDAINGTFTGLAEGDVAGTYSGFDWQISYVAGDGNDISLFAVAATVIPEPSTALLSALGLLALLRRKR